MENQLLQAALRAKVNGISTVPVRLPEKTPTVDEWKGREKRGADERQIRKDYQGANGDSGVAIIGGQVSGHLEFFDFDIQGEFFEPFIANVEAAAPDLIGRLPLERTLNGGFHLLIRCPTVTIPGSQKLARKKVEVDGPGLHEFRGKNYTSRMIGNRFFIFPAAIETKAEGGYIVCAPSPGYTVIRPGENGDLFNIPAITEAEREILLRCARALEEQPPETATIRNGPKPATPGEVAGMKPGSDFNQRGDVLPILLKHGFQLAGGTSERQQLTRPGKDRGISATLYDGRTMRMFSSNAPPFEIDTNYSALAILAMLDYGGDYSAAARALRREGYGDREREKPAPAPAANEADDERAAIQAEGCGGHDQSQPPIANPTDSTPAEKPKGLPQPLSPDDTRVQLTVKPPDPVYIVNFQGAGMITAGSVGGIVGGSGMGKTTLMTHLAVMMARGGSWGFFEATKPLRVLFLPAEDDQEQVERKLWGTTGSKPIEGLHVKSVRGLVGPLMVYSESNPVPGPWWEWLKQTVILHHPLDVLMIDPKSRFYGLEENSNEENVAWVQCLEKLSQETGAAIAFSHHPPKGTRELNQWMARGGGGLVDACRWFMGMLPMSEEEGQRFGVEDWMNHFQAAVIKTNIGPKSKGSAWFRMNEDGLIEAADVVELKESNWGRRLAELLQDRLQDADCSPKYLTAHELMKEKEGKSIYEIMRECFAGFRRRTDMRGAIEWAVKWDLLKEIDMPQEKGRKRIELVPLADAMKGCKSGF
ncbi:MAG: AAA family ATPase [Deltaproteobacteria bacterium]|nr:AAA family ATPase [Deltaproteobacteria bacterium]